MSKEKEIINIDRKVHHLIKQELDILDNEYKELLRAIELILNSIRRHEDFHFAASNRKVMLSTLFGLVDTAVKLCHRQHDLAKEKVYGDFGIQINGLITALRKFKEALDSKLITSSAEAAGQFTVMITEPSRKTLEALNEIIKERETLLDEVLSGSKAA